MAEKRHEQSGFKVTDRRLFTSEGELRSDAPEEVEAKAAAAPTTIPQEMPPAAKAPANVPEASADAAPEREMPPPPTSAEQEAQAAAYRQPALDTSPS